MSTSLGVRERILKTAGELFYREGVRAVGVDLIVAESGVAKTSLYRHFATKDDLVAAFVDDEDAAYWREWDAVASRHRGDAKAELDAHVSAIARHIAEPGYRGCPFLNVVTEFPERGHPGRIAAAKNKTELHRRIASLVDRIGVRNAREVTGGLVLLIDGAYANAALASKNGPSRALAAAARALVGAALPAKPRFERS